ncbi:beta-ketoacyl-[acyl-carrier-protein] synthase family protein [Promicromonospora sp. MEB111]|uniref:beta-ketoacyl-[acyl-carrier-protein] synthase family protein n=1 Tax=Promicromonospora sp. MEB111 TaxID=3040301 RepID=UPI00254D3E21|nr:beta-ketoacyl-[acyl-carrier-protein] synthase family protein [Promicromonospora sp. MEB111]
MTRVAVTGFGALTPLGLGAEPTWSALRAGRSGIRQIGAEIADNAPVRIAGMVDPAYVEALPVRERRRLDRAEQFTLLAGREAWAMAGRPAVDPDRLATAIGTAYGGIGSIVANEHIRVTKGARQVSPHLVTMLLPNGPAAWLSIELGARAGAHAPTTACAAGAEALATGVNLIRSGTADVVVAGGADAGVTPLSLTGFAQMRALSTNPDPASASRPFDQDRDGFVLAEGAVVLVLEREDHARARGAAVHGYIDGTAVTSDGRDIVNADPANQARTITRALRDAEAEPADVGLVHAHATSTPAGDRNESDALTAAGIAAPVTATKSMTGHMLGAAGAAGTFAALQALRHQVIPPTVNTETVDPEIPHDIVTTVRGADMGVALVNSFGFGGHNVALVVRSR